MHDPAFLALPLLCDVKTVRELLGIGERQAQRLLACGKLGLPTRIGGRLRVRRDHLWRALGGDNEKGKSK